MSFFYLSLCLGKDHLPSLIQIFFTLHKVQMAHTYGSSLLPYFLSEIVHSAPAGIIPSPHDNDLGPEIFPPSPQKAYMLECLYFPCPNDFLVYVNEGNRGLALS